MPPKDAINKFKEKFNQNRKSVSLKEINIGNNITSKYIDHIIDESL